MSAAIIVRDIMSHPVQTIPRATSVLDAAKFFLRTHFSGAPVVDESGAVVGILTLRDMAKFFLEPALRSTAVPVAVSSPMKLKVSDLMTPHPHSLRPGDLIEVASAAMKLHRTHRLLVTDEAGKLVGIVSTSDLVYRAGNYH
ncbi:MAG: CBS domain-containing protein [Planctomycetes bacterium]|nr:CBS domain-containing protein [Planctomycetota bacterium]